MVLFSFLLFPSAAETCNMDYEDKTTKNDVYRHGSEGFHR